MMSAPCFPDPLVALLEPKVTAALDTGARRFGPTVW